jgi:flagella basal body P-ring formation protein FlgA
MIAAARTLRSLAVAAAIALALVPATASAGAAAEAEVRALIEATLPIDLALVSITAPSDLGTVDLEVRWKAAPRAGKSRVLVLTGPEKSRRSRWVAIELAQKQRVPVVRRALAAGAIITTADVATEDRAFPGALAVDADALIGLRVRRAVAAGTVLTEADVELGPPVARGTEVQVSVRTGAMAVTTRGRLENAARVGDQVRVRIEATRRIVSGRLTGAGTVLVAGASR